MGWAGRPRSARAYSDAGPNMSAVCSRYVGCVGRCGTLQRCAIAASRVWQTACSSSPAGRLRRVRPLNLLSLVPPARQKNSHCYFLPSSRAPMAGVSVAIVCRTFGPWSCATNRYCEPRLKPRLKPRLRPLCKPMPLRFSVLPLIVAYLAACGSLRARNEGGSARNRVVFIKRVHSRSHSEKQCGSEK